jgi:hypothetical protein
MGEEGVINQRIRDFSKQIDIMQTIVIFLIAFLVPTFLGKLLTLIFGAESVIATNSQLVVGSIVNAALVVTATNLKGIAKIAGVVTMPSISAILGGYVFHTASVYAVYMIPAIWLGNFSLVYMYKLIMLAKQKNYFLAGLAGVVAKVAIIFGGFSLLKAFSIFPEKVVTVLQTQMGVTQAITATIGVVLAFGIIKLIEKK